MNRKAVISWAFYDWANSAYATTVMAGVFPIFFKEYFTTSSEVTTSTAQLGFINTIASLIIVILAPLLLAVVALVTEDSRAAITSIAVFFILDALLLMKVDAEQTAKELRESLR